MTDGPTTTTIGVKDEHGTPLLSDIQQHYVDMHADPTTPEGRDRLARAMARSIMIMTDHSDDCEELKRLWTIMTYAQTYLSRKDDQMRARRRVLEFTEGK